MVAADRFGRDVQLFGRVLNGEMSGNTAMGITKITDQDASYGLESVQELFDFVNKNTDAILQASPDLFKVRNAANDIFVNSQTLLNETSKLAELFREQSDSRVVGPNLAYFILAVLVLRDRLHRFLPDPRFPGASEADPGAERTEPERHPATAGRTGRPGRW